MDTVKQALKKMSVMEKTMFITVDDYERLIGLIEVRNRDSEIADRLMKELKSARTFPQNKISENIVTMNSRARLREINSGREIEITVTYPEQADNRQQMVSVFSPIGVALLGCREGDITSWRVPGGIGRFKVEKVLYQPEAQEFSLFVKRADAEEEKQSLQLQLQHVERLAFVGELSAGIAHELNEPLGRILGFAQLIRKTGGLNEQQSEDIERIIKASLYTREIIKKLMIFSRQMPRQITWVNLNEVVTNILYFIDMRFIGREVSILQKLDEKLPSIQADEVQMTQVLVNLITNSIHAMPRGGELTIRTRKLDKGVSLTVRDTGLGMTGDVRKKIFEPFYSTKPVGQGTGLGLSVVQGIVIDHGGKIQVSSQPGKGTRIEVLLPLKQTSKHDQSHEKEKHVAG